MINKTNLEKYKEGALSVICPECGHLNRKYAGFCEECQADLRSLPENKFTSSKSVLNTNLLIMVAILAVTLLIFIFLLNYLTSNLI